MWPSKPLISVFVIPAFVADCTPGGGVKSDCIGVGSNQVVSIEDCLVIPNFPPCLAAGNWAPGRRAIVFAARYFMPLTPPVKTPCWRRAVRWGVLPRQVPSGCQGMLLRQEKKVIRLGDPLVRHRWNGVHVALEPACFFQSNPASWPCFFAWIDRYLKLCDPQTVWDVHAGAGFLSSRLRVGRLLASEPDEGALAQLVTGLSATGVKGTSMAGHGRVGLGARRLDEGPGRRGVGSHRAWVCRRPCGSGWWKRAPNRLLFFPVTPATFSRDLAALAASYRLVSPIGAINTNPGTTRLETAVILRRAVS